MNAELCVSNKVVVSHAVWTITQQMKPWHTSHSTEHVLLSSSLLLGCEERFRWPDYPVTLQLSPLIQF